MKSNQKEQLAQLNDRYESLSQLERMKQLFNDFSQIVSWLLRLLEPHQQSSYT